MTNTNVVVLKGNMTRELDETSFGYTNKGVARATVSIAVNRSVKRGEEWVDDVSYFDVTIWGKTAENLKPYLHKGTGILVTGYLKQDRWEKDGQKHSKVTINADTVELVGSREKKESENGSGYNRQTETNSSQDDGFLSGGEDIPF